MAQNARIASLTDDLIQSILQFDPETNKRAYKHAKDIAARGLKAHQYNRTNQFDVQTSFNGLNEKFSVLNRDDLAEALSSRFKEIQQIQGRQTKWIPEHLSLLLQLSDRPTENSQVEALELLRPPTPASPLTWSQIIADDPYSDEEIWKDIDYAAESSDDERTHGKRGKKIEIPSPSSIDEDDTYDAESGVVPVDSNAVSEIENAQYWKTHHEDERDNIEITELQAVRETLFMLAGLPTSLYVTDKQYGNVHVDHRYVLSHVIAHTTAHLLSQLANIGRQLYRLRQWTRHPSALPLIQTFEAVARARIADYDRYLAELQQRYLVPDTPISVSLLELHNEIRTSSTPILRLARLVEDIEPQLLVNPFAHLEALFDQIALAQMTLEKDVFDYLSNVFFECLQTYLKPIRKWMESGELGSNDETFFVFENDSSSEVSSLWHDRFVLRRGKGDALRSPHFLQPAALKIFNTGKSVVFLKELGIYGSGVSFDPEPKLNHDIVCGAADLPISPFPELFNTAFEAWIRSKYSFASSMLKKHLFSRCGLFNILNIFRLLHLGGDGSVFQDFANAIFERMDSEQRGWNDRFLLTELARGMYGPVLGQADAEKIIVRSVRMKNQTRSVKSLATVSVEYAVSTCRSPWAQTMLTLLPSFHGRS
jgi:gamma-tubulin complex component 5